MSKEKIYQVHNRIHVSLELTVHDILVLDLAKTSIIVTIISGAGFLMARTISNAVSLSSAGVSCVFASWIWVAVSS